MKNAFDPVQAKVEEITQPEHELESAIKQDPQNDAGYDSAENAGQRDASHPHFRSTKQPEQENAIARDIKEVLDHRHHRKGNACTISSGGNCMNLSMGSAKKYVTKLTKRPIHVLTEMAVVTIFSAPA